jgi:hypothetical protein
LSANPATPGIGPGISQGQTMSLSWISTGRPLMLGRPAGSGPPNSRRSRVTISLPQPLVRQRRGPFPYPARPLGCMVHRAAKVDDCGREPLGPAP